MLSIIPAILKFTREWSTHRDGALLPHVVLGFWIEHAFRLQVGLKITEITHFTHTLCKNLATTQI